ncbi:apolipo protein O-domain-containing protein [Scheffersomyces coipomensis]|uniref:apolipo protein O-domain-containing protein n=1 Tax=Scheffersomyces coipomensis TaxID=1788519 RepID=UPI00315DF013
MAGSKRTFYADDELVITKPGTNSEITPELQEKESAHGNISFIQGMGVRTTPYLEKYANQFRLFIHDKVSIADAELNTQVSAFNNEVASIKSQIDSVIQEPLLPSLVYILTFTLTGSILVNRRALPLRFITPIIFGTSSLAYFMPNTFHTITSKYENYEKEHFQEFNYQKNQLIFENLRTFKEEFQNSLDEANKIISSSVHDARSYITDLISDDDK